MADKDSTTITNAATMADADLLAGVQGGNSRDFPGSVIKTYVTPTNAETKTAYEANADTNAFDDAAVTKLAGIETAATADQTGAEIKTAYEGEADTNPFTDAEQTKLSGIETAADVTDSTNVNAAGATMNTDADVSGNSWVLDEDDLTSDSATKVPTQQSVKAYVDANGGGGSNPLGSETFSASSATTGIDVSGIASTSGIRIEVMDGSIASGPHTFALEYSTDGGTTWKQATTDYSYNGYSVSGATYADFGDTTIEAFYLSIPTGGTTTNFGSDAGFKATVKIGNPNDGTFLGTAQSAGKLDNGNSHIGRTTCWYTGTGTVDTIRLVPGGGTMSGRWAVFEDPMA